MAFARVVVTEIVSMEEVVGMVQKLTMKVLSGELEALRKQLHEVESHIEHKLEDAIETTREKLNARIKSIQGQGLDIQGHGAAVDVDSRHRLIAECAYLRAERRGFMGNPEQDWLDAEREIDERLLRGQVKTGTLKTGGRKKTRTQVESRV